MLRRDNSHDTLDNLMVYRMALKKCAANGDLAAAEATFAEMLSKGITPDLPTNGLFIMILCDLGKEDRAIELLQHRRSNEWRGPFPFLSLALRLIERTTPDWDKFTLVLEGMLEDRLTPPDRLISGFVNAYIQTGNDGALEVALELIHSMEKTIGLAVASSSVYAPVIAKYCANGDLEAALSLLTTIKERGTVLSSACLPVMEKLLQTGEFAKVEDIFGWIKLLGTVQDDNAFQLVAEAYQRQPLHPDTAAASQRLLRDLLKLPVSSSNAKSRLFAVNQIFRVIVFNCGLESIKDSYELLTSHCKPNARTYRLVIGACCQYLDVDSVDVLLQDLVRSGHVPDAQTMDSVVRLYATLKQREKAIDAFRMAQSFNYHPPQIDIFPILQCLDHPQRLEFWDALVESRQPEALAESVQPRQFSRKRQSILLQLLDSCRILHSFDNANKYWTFFRSKLGVQPDIDSYATMILIEAKAKQFGRVFELVDEVILINSRQPNYIVVGFVKYFVYNVLEHLFPLPRRDKHDILRKYSVYSDLEHPLTPDDIAVFRHDISTWKFRAPLTKSSAELIQKELGALVSRKPVKVMVRRTTPAKKKKPER
jgi:pentatricopeptide repeat protein